MFHNSLKVARVAVVDVVYVAVVVVVVVVVVVDVVVVDSGGVVDISDVGRLPN